MNLTNLLKDIEKEKCLSHRSVKDMYTLLGTGKLKCIVGRQCSKWFCDQAG